jgi:hypothetical protein
MPSLALSTTTRAVRSLTPDSRAHSLTDSLTHSLARSLTHACMQVRMHTKLPNPLHSLTHSLTNSLGHKFVQLMLSLARSLKRACTNTCTPVPRPPKLTHSLARQLPNLLGAAFTSCLLPGCPTQGRLVRSCFFRGYVWKLPSSLSSVQSWPCLSIRCCLLCLLPRSRPLEGQGA